RSARTCLAASSVRHPVGTSTTMPLPSRSLAYHVPDSIRMRSPASVNGAVRVFPFVSRQRASFSPLRVMISASAGNGLVTVLRYTEPMSVPLSLEILPHASGPDHDLQPQCGHQPIDRLETHFPQTSVEPGEQRLVYAGDSGHLPLRKPGVSDGVLDSFADHRT